jgi:hypothetical protein
VKTRLLCVLLLALALTACSGMRIVDSDVHTYTAAQGITVPASYRFERLPSQMAQTEQRDNLEAMVQAELDKVGMRLDEAASRYSVRLELRVHRDPRSPWDDARYSAGLFLGFPVVTRHGVVYQHPAPFLRMETPWYRREVSLLIRRLADGVLVYETRASSDGNWTDDAAVVPAMFEAALRDFPNPPPGPRRIDIEIPR